MSKKQKKNVVSNYYNGSSYGDIVTFYLSRAYWFVLYMVPYLIIGYDILIKAGKGIKNRQICLMRVFLWQIRNGWGDCAGGDKSGDYTGKLIAVMLFYQGWRMVSELCGGKEPKKYQ